MTKLTVDELALQYSNKLESMSDSAPKTCINPGLYYGYKAGFDKCHDLIMQDVQMLVEALEFINRWTSNSDCAATMDANDKAKEALAYWHAKYGKTEG